MKAGGLACSTVLDRLWAVRIGLLRTARVRINQGTAARERNIS